MELQPKIQKDGMEIIGKMFIWTPILLSLAGFVVMMGPHPFQTNWLYIYLGVAHSIYGRIGCGILVAAQLYNTWVIVTVVTLLGIGYLNNTEGWLKLIKYLY